MLAASATAAAGNGGNGSAVYFAEKLQNYTQFSSAGAVATTIKYPFEFLAQADMAATITPTGGNSEALTAHTASSNFQFAAAFQNKAGLDAAFPDGFFTLSGSSIPSVKIDLTFDSYPAAIPAVVAVAGATNPSWQNGVLMLNAVQDNTLTFSAFDSYNTASPGASMAFSVTSATPADNISLGLSYSTSQLVGETTYSLTPFNSFTIPANTLTPGLTYSGRLVFSTFSSLDTVTLVPTSILGLFTNELDFVIVAQPLAAVPAPVIATQPANQSVVVGANATFAVGVTYAGSNQAPAETLYEWFCDGLLLDLTSGHDTVGADGSLTINAVGPNDAGAYALQVVNAGGRAISQYALLTIPGISAGPPSILTQPQSQTIASGSTVAFTVTAAGSEPLSYQWQRDGAPVTLATAVGANTPTLVINRAVAVNAGTYTCVVANAAGSALSNAASLDLISSASPGRLINLSILSYIQGSLSMGFVVGGGAVDGPESLLIRGVAPSIGPGTPFGVLEVMSDPTLTVVQQATQTTLATDAGWGSTPSNAAAVQAADAATGAFALANTASLDSALVLSLPAVSGGYSAIVTGRTGDNGNALTEVYDDTPAYLPGDSRLINLSCLTQVATGGTIDVGFVLGGTTAKTVLVRVGGPVLNTLYGIGGVMPDPQLQISPLGSSSTVLASDAGWGGGPQLVSVANSVGAYVWPDTTSLDSAAVLTLPPGRYTVQVNSVSGVGGTVLVEIYDVP